MATLPVFAQKSEQQKSEEFNSRLNKKPLQDFAKSLTEKVEKSEVDISKSFSVTLESVLTKDGNFDPKQSRFTKSEGDAKMIVVAKEAIESLGYTNIFVYFAEMGVKKLKINFAQDEKEISFIVDSELPIPERVRTISSAFNGLLSIAKMNVKEEEVKFLLNNSRVMPQDKNFIFSMVLPKEMAHQLLKIELQKVTQKSYTNSGVN
jgi:hypothetical protein